ncbi:hypothetical protein [Candidatus Binatus sp.]|uniref:hypothetical protein n=1 Tax=Candidatus Binatus sp. TaxID=2811406 RepID=UPI003CB43C84
MIEVILAIAAAALGVGLAVGLPEGQKKWGAIPMAIAGLLFVYALILVLFPRTFSIEIAQLHLTNPGNVIGEPIIPAGGTGAFLTIRVQNRGETNSLIDWRFNATTIDGTEHQAVLIGYMKPTKFFLRDSAHPSPEDFSLDPSEQIVNETESPITNGEWKMGYAIFVFNDVPIETLRLPGTRFTVKCTDVLNHGTISTDLLWTGVNSPVFKYPGLKYGPINP